MLCVLWIQAPNVMHKLHTIMLFVSWPDIRPYPTYYLSQTELIHKQLYKTFIRNKASLDTLAISRIDFTASKNIDPFN